MQAQAAQAAVLQQSLLAVFPTGGGKSITFQVPVLMAGEYSKALTVIISPLQSLMKDQVDNLEQRDITEAVTINGLLDPMIDKNHWSGWRTVQPACCTFRLKACVLARLSGYYLGEILHVL